MKSIYKGARQYDKVLLENYSDTKYSTEYGPRTHTQVLLVPDTRCSTDQRDLRAVQVSPTVALHLVNNYYRLQAPIPGSHHVGSDDMRPRHGGRERGSRANALCWIPLIRSEHAHVRVLR